MRAAAGICLSLVAAAPASADDYVAKNDDRVAEFEIDSDFVAYSSFDHAYKMPRVWVQGQSVNTDSYQCADTDRSDNRREYLNNWVIVPDDTQTAALSFSSTSTLGATVYGAYTHITTWNWSDPTAKIRAVISCTNNTDAYPTDSYGDYYDAWTASLWSGNPDFRCLAKSAFHIGVPCSHPSRSVRAAGPPLATLTPAASPGGNSFPLVNGSNSLALTFRWPRSTLRPPAIYYSTSPARADCTARRLHVPVNDGHGYMRLVLRCAGLKPGATAKLRIRPAIRRTFRLEQGRGTGHVRLDKPPGSVKPLVFLGTRPATAPCTIRSRQTRMTRRTLELRVTGHCGRVARGTVGELAVGGLIAAR